ncbi:alpha/beta fold hydrolase [Paracoccus caeni]|uniref:Alpha/beta fold hydrolase n=1 Tax=Paracoccus caeni TaxID=657651 RepID=A0A934SCC3_9RHOB|nr:alpha/beta fold hydrolase [Paracoccus caeni]MBK4215307.1 alpha/beta fold hydrolase [Paracoccus caeni]
MAGLLKIAAISGAAIALLLAFGPREPADLSPVEIQPIPDPAAWLAERDRGIRPEVASYLHWASEAGERTDLAVVYIHGFSASPAELRPLPEDVARTLGANVVAIRLTGHGEDGAAMDAARVRDWWGDVAQALAIGRMLGRKVAVIGMSTGATLVAEAARDPELSQQFDAAVLIAPNFRISARWAWLLDLPLMRSVLRLAGQPERCFETRNPAHEAGWTACYPVSAALPVSALLRHARKGDFNAAGIPALFIWSDSDTVLDHRATERVAESWGGEVEVKRVQPGPRDDPGAHVIAGNALAPDLTAELTPFVADWIAKALR